MKFTHYPSCTRGQVFEYEDSEDGYTEIEIGNGAVALNCDRCGAHIIIAKDGGSVINLSSSEERL